jgi:hypothetical protein
MEIWRSPFLRTKAFSIKSIGNILFIFLVTLLFGFGLFLVISGLSAIESKVIPTVNLSHKSGVYNAPFKLSVGYSNATGVIKYTLDGSDPTNESKKYEEEITIDKDSVVKVALSQNGEIKSDITKSSFVFNYHTVPIVSIITDPVNLWSSKTGIYVKGLDTNPASYNYMKKGEDWQKPAYMEIFDETGAKKLGQDVEIRVSGGKTRANAQKSLRVCALKEKGAKYINYDFFGNGKDTHKCIILRNSGNDWRRTMFRDLLAQTVINDMDLDTQDGTPSVLYLNGNYWGIHNIREFYDDHYLRIKYGTKKESIVMLEPDRQKGGYPLIREGAQGDELDYVKLTQNLNDYEYIKGHMDVGNYIDYFLSQIYFANDDWLENNIRVWRFKSESYSSYDSAPLDGKWRWLVFDLDSAMGLFGSSDYNADTLSFATNEVLGKGTWATEMIRSLLTREDFRIIFINRYADLLNTTFESSRVLGIVERIKVKYKPEISMHALRWGGRNDKGGKPAFENLQMWEKNVETLETFAKNRAEFSRKHFIKKFGLSGTSKVFVTADAREGGYLKINTINTRDDIKIDTLVYFNDIPIEVEAVPNFGYSFAGWSDTSLGLDTKLTITLSKDIDLKPIFEPAWWMKLLGKV